MASCKWGFYVFLHRKVALKQVFLLLIGKGIYEGCLPTEIKAFVVDHNTSKRETNYQLCCAILDGKGNGLWPQNSQH